MKLMAALLHDVIEDTPAYQDMEQLFGKSVAELVEEVSKR